MILNYVSEGKLFTAGKCAMNHHHHHDPYHHDQHGHHGYDTMF